MSGKRKMGNAVNLLDLPADALLQILSRLDHKDRLSLSLLSKDLRSLTNSFVRKLSFHDPDCLLPYSKFRKLFDRFYSVTQVSIYSNRFDRALFAVADAGLKVEVLEIGGKHSFPKAGHMVSLSGMFRLVRRLRFNWSSMIEELEVAEFIHLFESLEELDLSGDCFQWSDKGIACLSFKCPNLRKVKLSNNHHLTFLSLCAFAAYSVNLEHISVDGCSRIKLLHICVFMHTTTNLKSLELLITEEMEYLVLAKILPSCDNLNHLSIKGVNITNDWLLAIANIFPNLTSLKIKPDDLRDNSYTMTGVATMLSALKGLTSLHIYLPRPGSDNQDTEMSKFVKSLHGLKDVLILY